MNINIITCKYGYYLSNVFKIHIKKKNISVIKENINLSDNITYNIIFTKNKKISKNYIL